MKNDLKEIVITKNTCINFPKADSIKGNILILGNYNGVCGDVKWDRQNGICEIGYDMDEATSNVFRNNMNTIFTALENKYKIVFVGSKETIAYFKTLLYAAGDIFLLSRFGVNKNELKRNYFNKCVYTIDITDIYNKTFIEYNSHSKYRKNKAHQYINDIVANKIFKRLDGMKFDTIIQNPPYNKTLHLDFFEKGLDLLTDTGKMVIIEPATWLINVRKNGNAKIYNTIKERINGHIESVVIENLNKEFGTANDTPFAITTIDMSKTFDTIDFTCCGEVRKVKSIYDCNLVGDYTTIWSIFDKILSLKTAMSEHIVESKKSQTKENKGFYFLGFTDGFLNALGTNSIDMLFTAPNDRVRSFHTLGEFASQYIECSYKGNIEYNIVPTSKKGNKMYCIYGTQTELENWKHFIFNNKLPLFLNIVLTIDQHNNSKEFLPWLVDKQYTDDEINKLFGFTDDEIKLIDTTIKKYEKNSPWFKRYICGKDAATDEEVNTFIEKINN